MQIKLRGCDISHWQGNIDFKRLKKSCDFVIIKAGGTDTSDFFYADKRFERNYAAAKAAGLKVGCYFFAGEFSQLTENGTRDAGYFYNIIKGKSFEMPVYLDYELGNKNSKRENTRYAVAFCNLLERLGYFTGIYGSDISTFKDLLNYEDIRRYSLWVARYGKRPDYVKNYAIWQYSSSGKLDGIKGKVDLDYAYTDLSNIIVKKHLNNCK